MNNKHYAVLIVVVVLLFVVPLVLLPSAEFGGADSGAEQAISDTGYTPWFTSIWEPPSGEIETLAVFASSRHRRHHYRLLYRLRTWKTGSSKTEAAT